MANKKWIKFIIGTFNGESFKKIKKDEFAGGGYRDKLTAIWFELLDLAGKGKGDGVLIKKDETPYDKLGDIAKAIERTFDEVQMCMIFFISEEMIVDNGKGFQIANWDKYQRGE